MGNSWKAKCVKDYYGWKKGTVIEVVNGIVLESDNHGAGGLSVEEVETFEKWCNATNPLSWELITDKAISDNINPDHYKSQCSLECIETMRMAFGGTVVYDFCICNAWKYMWRYQNKNGKEDLTKARWYLEMAEKVDCDRTEHWNIETVLNELEEKLNDN